MDTVVSADLAYRNYHDIGIAVLQGDGRQVTCSFLDPAEAGLRGHPNPEMLAAFLMEFCHEVGSRILLLDGPQAWKDPANGLEHSRQCERMLNTPAKTGLPGTVKPGNYLPFVAFSIAVFDALNAQGWSRYPGGEMPDGQTVAIESFPMSAWKGFGMYSLPAKARCRADEITARVGDLQALLPLQLSQQPNHDQLQALVAGLAGIGLLGSPLVKAASSGVSPFELEGVWREGLIVNPTMST